MGPPPVSGRIPPAFALINGPPADTVPRACRPPNEPQTDDGFEPSAHAPGTLVPGFYSRPAAVLGRSRLRDPAALRYGDGSGHVSSGDHVARAGAKAVEGRLCAALAAAEGRPLWRKPQPD